MLHKITCECAGCEMGLTRDYTGLTNPKGFPNPKGLPVIPPLPDPIIATDEVALCGECGRTIKRVEWFNCMNNRCPLGSKATW